MHRPAPFHVFTPQRDEPEELEKILVKREPLLADAVEKVRESVLQADKHHLLLVGPRGMGKSYLVTLIQHRLSKQDDLADKMRFAWLNEDQTSTTFLHLLSRIYRKMVDQYPNEFPAAALEEIRGKAGADAREILGNALVRGLGKRTIVLLIENIDAIFRSMSAVEQRTWRGFIQDHSRISTVATAQGLTDDVSSKEKPFYGFFDMNHLEPLTVEEATELLEKIARLNGNEELAKFITTVRGKARMRAIHRLSGGNPRLYLILSDFLTKEVLDDLVRLFEETVDRQLTPYFQERIRWISPQQQEIVQYLCQLVHPASVKEIAEGVFAKQNTVSSQLKQLREKGYLVARSRGKESMYELAEPLMRLSFQVKEMNNRQPLALIVDFVRVWYDRQDIERRLEGILPGAWGRDYFEVALKKIETEGNALRHSLMLAGIEDIDVMNCGQWQLEELQGVAEETNKPEAWIKYGRAGLHLELPAEKLIQIFSRVTDLSDLSSMNRVTALIGRSAAYFQAGDFDGVIADCSTALEMPGLPGDSPNYFLRMRGSARVRKGELEMAGEDFTRIIESGAVKDSMLVEALIKRAEIYEDTECEAQALADYSRVIQLSEASPAKLSRALFHRGGILAKSNDFELAIADFSHIITSSKSPQEWVGPALLMRATLLWFGGRSQEAIGDLHASMATKEKLPILALPVLAEIFLELHRYEESIGAIVRMAAEKNSRDLPPTNYEKDLGQITVTAAYGLRDTPEKWVSAVRQILPALSEWKLIVRLVAALIDHLRTLRVSDLNHTALDRWVADWETVGRGYPEVQMGIRMLRAGVEWIKTKDEGELLDLVTEERAIVREALELGPEKEG